MLPCDRLGGQDRTTGSFRRSLRARQRPKADQRSNIWTKAHYRRTQLMDRGFHSEPAPRRAGAKGYGKGGLLRHLRRAMSCHLDRNRNRLQDRGKAHGRLNCVRAGRIAAAPSHGRPCNAPHPLIALTASARNSKSALSTRGLPSQFMRSCAGIVLYSWLEAR